MRDTLKKGPISILEESGRNLQGQNGPEMEILRAQMYGRPSENIFLGRATSEYHALTRIKTGARQETLRSS